MLELLAIATGVELGKFVLNQVLDLSKPVLESYVQDFFKDCLDGGVARLKTNTLKQPMAEAIGYFVQRFIKELQFHDVPDNSINHHYESTLKQFVRNKAVGSILGKAFETGCKKIDYAQLETVWKGQYQQPGWLFPAEDFDWRRVTKEYVIQVKSIVKADAELRALLEADLLEELVFNTAQLSPGFDLEKYRESLQTSYGYLKLYALDSSYRADSIRLWHMFIEQKVREALPPTRYDLPLDIRRQLLKAGALESDLSDEALITYRHEYFQQQTNKVLKAVTEAQHAIILGDPGSGKSTLLQFLALDWVEGKTEVFPLLIELREYALAQSTNFLDFLHRGKGVDWQFDQQRLHQYLLENPTLVMFDGLDEVFDRPTYSAIIGDIIRFAQSYSKARILVTSRIIGYNPEHFQHAGFRQFTIQALDETEIYEFIDRWYDLSMGNAPDRIRLKKRLKDAIDNSKAIQNLADNPLLLTMMAILNRRQELPRDRADLYDQASRVLLYHWDVDHKDMNLPLDAIGRREKQEMLRLIAYEMQAGEEGLKGNLIHAERLIHIVTNYLHNQGFSEPREKANALIQQLRERNFILCYRGADTYGFVHRTFLEYFCAVEIVNHFEKHRILTFKQLRDEIFGQHWQDNNWSEVLRLVAGMINPQFAGEISHHLLDIIPLSMMEEDEENSWFQNEELEIDLYRYILNHVGGDIVFVTSLIREAQNIYELRISPAFLIDKFSSFVGAVGGYPGEVTIYDFIDLIDESSKIIEAIAELGKDDEYVFRWLSDLALDAVLQEFCLFAIRCLPKNYSSNQEVIVSLCKAARENRLEEMDASGSQIGRPVPSPRRVALEVLALHYPEEPLTVDTFRDRATNDADPELRKWAFEQLVILVDERTD